MKLDTTLLLTLAVINCSVILQVTNGTLIASSSVRLCKRTSAGDEPLRSDGSPCKKKFVVVLAVGSGKVCKMIIL